MVELLFKLLARVSLGCTLLIHSRLKTIYTHILKKKNNAKPNKDIVLNSKTENKQQEIF